MTDKQIVDVTQCPHYKERNVCTFLPYETKCEGECIWVTYKEMEEQRKRSEAQCEAMFISHTDLEKKYKAKEQECKELKKQIKYEFDETLLQYSNELDRLGAENDDLKEYIIHLHNLCGNETDKQYKYKQTLTEIKEIAETCSYTDNSELLLSRIEHILQKISEVENE